MIQLIGSDGEQMAKHLDNELMDEMAETGFREIWIADYSHNGTPMGRFSLLGSSPNGGECYIHIDSTE